MAECLALGFEFVFRAATARCVGPAGFGRMRLIWSYANLGWIVLAPVLVALFALVLRTRADHHRPAMPLGS